MNDIKMCKSMQIGLLQRINNVEQADKHQMSSKSKQIKMTITDINQENSCLIKEHRLKKGYESRRLKKVLNDDDEKNYCIII